MGQIETLVKIGGSRLSVAAVMTSEIIAVPATGVVLAAVLTFVTSPAFTTWLDLSLAIEQAKAIRDAFS